MDAGLKRARIALLAAALSLSGCHYAHLVGGHYDLMGRRVAIADLLVAPDTDPVLRERLSAALAARRFAIEYLRLPDNDSYTIYADVGRPYVQWSVMAAPELSLDPRQWCYLFVGCFSYIGYYEESRARDVARELAGEGYDTHIGGIAAYSTLGWFDDPVLNTMLNGSDEQLAGLLFHELAHQQLHVRNDTAFNESFASFVEEQGLREYLRGQPDRLQAWLAVEAREAELTRLMLTARSRLQAIYDSADDDAAKRLRKREAFERLRAEYSVLRGEWGGEGAFDRWFDDGLNNARLLPFGLYHQWVPSFRALFSEVGSDWDQFYRRVSELGDLDGPTRQAELERLALPLGDKTKVQ